MLIKYANLNGTYNAFYSTPSMYTAAKVANTPLPLRDEDVMPYFDDAHAVWSGYFSSRPALKHYIRDSSAVFQVAKQLQAAAAPPADMGPGNPLFALERAVAVTQHHDAVAGTSKQHVAHDYARQLAGGRLSADPLIGGALATLTGYAGAPFVACDLANATICPALEAGAAVVVALYNQASQAMDLNVRLPVGFPAGTLAYTVANATGGGLQAQLLPLSAADAHLRSAYYAYAGNGAPVSWLAFQVPQVPPMGFATVFITPSPPEGGAAAPAAALAAAAPSAPARAVDDTVLSNGVVSLTFSAATGLLTSFAHPAAGVSAAFSQTLLWWNSSTGNFRDDHTGDFRQSSGAYIMRPNQTAAMDAFPVAAPGAPVNVTFLASGPAVWEARQTFSPWASQVVRLWAGSAEVEFEWTVGPIPFADGLGKEVIARYSTDLATNKTWVSDSNCRDAQTRVRNARRSFVYFVYEDVAGNYVPANCFQAARDVATGVQLSVVTDRTQSASSLHDGSLEFMLHRRLLADDNRGVGEPLNEVRARVVCERTGVGGGGLSRLAQRGPRVLS